MVRETPRSRIGNSRNDPSAPILIMGGSYGKRSATSVLMSYTAKLFEERDMRHETLPLGALDLPFYHPDLHAETCPPAEFLLDACRRARAFVWCTPAYHYSISGAFKNAIDFLELTADDDPPYLGGRLVGLVATSQGPIAAVHAIGAMEQIVHALRGYVVPATAPIGPLRGAVDLDAGRVADERTKLKLVQMVEEMRDALASRT
ncbi:MAG TPA: NADPH-dependent FMN reductase [Stellaceae bacterium]|jgi:FMN reductase|nr:NADPH-dependent FMN reductase [Stellaceae bacterium]